MTAAKKDLEFTKRAFAAVATPGATGKSEAAE
jgi:hypothetical protein